MSDVEAVKELHQGFQTIKKELAKVIIGQDDVIDQMLIAMFSRGHCLLVGVPGLAKTLMISTLANVLDLKFSRVQFTPDLMPSDITGTDVIEEDLTTGKKGFRFIKGPVFTNMLLADEVNRTPPKTQSALLEAMQEHRVTASGETFVLEEPFFVLATQNPVEQEGTYPLPEAQQDRFMFNLWVDYPSEEEERQIVKSTTGVQGEQPTQVMGREKILEFQELVRRVPVSDHVVEYAVKLVHSSRPENEKAPQFTRDFLSWGAGPRAGQYLVLGAKTLAALSGRFAPEVDDVKAVAKPVLRHRLITNFNAEAEGVKPHDLVGRLVEHTDSLYA